jgi:type IV pilus assembly protein PilE
MLLFKKKLGITLIELLVVMSIISIIALAAFPTYQTHLRESRRQDAIIGIRDMQLNVDAFILAKSELPTSTDFPKKDSPEEWYEISYTNQNDGTYKIEANAKENTTQYDDKARSSTGSEIACRTIYITSQLDTTFPYECK